MQIIMCTGTFATTNVLRTIRQVTGHTSFNTIASGMRSRSGNSCRKKINGLPAGLTCCTFYFAITAHRASFGPLRSGYLQWDRYCE